MYRRSKILNVMWLGLVMLPLGARAQETVIRCESETLQGVRRVVCEPRVVDGQFSLPLPPEPPLAVIALPPVPDTVVSIVVPLPPDVSMLAIVLPPDPAKPSGQEAVHSMAFSAKDLQAALGQLVTSKRLDRFSADAVAQFYAKRDHAPLWLDKGQWSKQALSLRERLAAAHEDGLDPERYRSVAAFHHTEQTALPARAAAEVELTASVLHFASDISIGRIAPRQIHPLITPKRHTLDIDALLGKMLDADNAGQLLLSYAPPHAGYAALRAKLAALRTQSIVRHDVVIADGPLLRMGMQDGRVPLLRERLGLGYSNSVVFDRPMALKLAEFQKQSVLPVNGLLTPQTRRALNGDFPSPEITEIIANMEFWRWLPRQLGADHIFVNVPSHGLQLRQKNQVVHEARVIIGKGDTQTPIFSDEMDHVVVNPSWFVPPGILKKDPRYLDPEWVKARGYTMIRRGANVTVRVPPSASNALGNIKFMFPNDHAVYLHDTPNRRLFGAENRLLSNGCVRVENPFQLAAMIFENAGWSEERFKRLIGTGERRMNLPQKLPIHLAYLTTVVDAHGNLQRHKDVYGHMARMRQLLGEL